MADLIKDRPPFGPASAAEQIFKTHGDTADFPVNLPWNVGHAVVSHEFLLGTDEVSIEADLILDTNRRHPNLFSRVMNLGEWLGQLNEFRLVPLNEAELAALQTELHKLVNEPHEQEQV